MGENPTRLSLQPKETERRWGQRKGCCTGRPNRHDQGFANNSFAQEGGAERVDKLLDNNGYSESKFKAAWRNNTNEEITASIIGHIRQAALGEPLIPFEQRVHSSLERLGKLLVHEVIIDQGFVNNTFAQKDGAKPVEKLLGKVKIQWHFVTNPPYKCQFIL